MSMKRKLIYILSLILAVIVLCSCSTTVSYNICPSYPVGGEKVAEELEKVPYDGYEDFWEWIARINKLREELELCQ